jgi:hypothetical protein
MSQDRQLNTTSRRALLAGAPAAAAGALAAGAAVNAVAVAIVKAAEVDPIFAAITEHRTAVEEYGALCLAAAELMDFEPNKDPKSDAAKAASDDGRDRMLDALHDLLTEEPTTLLGVAALLEYFSQPDHGHDPEESILLGAAGWGEADEDIGAAALAFPAIIAETIRSLAGVR